MDSHVKPASEATHPNPGPAPRRLPTGPRAWPMVDPARTGEDTWFDQAWLVRRSEGAPGPKTRDEGVIASAWSMSRRAAILSGLGGDALVEAASLRVQAAERKRHAGAPAEAFEDYEALAEHFLRQSALKPAIAYMRKAMHVAGLVEDTEVRLASRKLAAETYASAGQKSQAWDMVKDAKGIALSVGIRNWGDFEAGVTERLRSSKALKSKRCCCGKAVAYPKCCGLADVPPVEFSDYARGLLDERTPGPYAGIGWNAFDTLMRPPAEGEGTTWYAWRVEDGCHRLVAFPNWSGRAMKSAERMAKLARDEKCAEAASSAVIQAFVAVETFLTSWKSLERMDTLLVRSQAEQAEARREQEAIEEAETATEDPEKVNDGKPVVRRAAQTSGERFVTQWTKTAKTTFPHRWEIEEREDFVMLAALRNALCHGVSVAETIVPHHADGDCFLKFFDTKNEFPVGPAPAPWVDRIMKPEVAEWAVGVAKKQIGAIRKAYVTDDELDWVQGMRADIEHDAFLANTPPKGARLVTT